MKFDIAEARKRASDDEIVKYLQSKDIDFDMATALQKGSATEVLDYLQQNDRPISIIPTKADIQEQRQTNKDNVETIKKENADEAALYKAQQSGKIGVPTPEQEALEFTMFDPISLAAENAVGTAIVKGLDRLKYPQWLKKWQSQFDEQTILADETLSTAEKVLKIEKAQDDFDTQVNTLSFMERNGMVPTDVLVHGSSSKDLAQYLSKGNLYSIKEAFDNAEIIHNDFKSLVGKTLGKLRNSSIDATDVKTWQNTHEVEAFITKEVKALRTKYRNAEDDLYGDAIERAKNIPDLYKIEEFNTNLVKTLTEKGVPPEATSALKRILNRFKVPYKEDTVALKRFMSLKGSNAAEIKALKIKQQTLIKEGKNYKAKEVQKQIDKKQLKAKEINDNIAELKDVGYTDTQTLLNTIKLINRKIYKPGGSLSVKDAEEIRGLVIAKNKLEEFARDNIKDQELKDLLRGAKDMTIARTKLFGAKDDGGEKPFLARALEVGDYGKVTEYITGKNGSENVRYIKELFGKDSEAYRQTLSLYINHKLGMTNDLIKLLKDPQKAIGIEDRIDLKVVSDRLKRSLTDRDYKLIEEYSGKQSAMDLKSLEKLVHNFNSLEDAAGKFGVGITGGEFSYIKRGPISNFMRVVKDYAKFKVGKTLTQVIHNQPKFRTLSGSITGGTIYLANTEQEDISLHDFLTSMVFGGATGYVAGKATRALLESDIAKVSRYMKQGKVGPNIDALPKDIRRAMNNVGQAIEDSEGKTLRQALHEGRGIGEVKHTVQKPKEGLNGLE